ncbi:MAG: hypothetical protein APR63_12725 [Desulfuromonas sp. SDB]|nr:MAG: hypothetical protein APR63_12725 [Desulfuromonas sp. SDB]
METEVVLTLTVTGSDIGGGIDIEINKLLFVYIGTGYYLISDYENNIGSSKYYSSQDFTFSLDNNFKR